MHITVAWQNAVIILFLSAINTDGQDDDDDLIMFALTVSHSSS